MIFYIDADTPPPPKKVQANKQKSRDIEKRRDDNPTTDPADKSRAKRQVFPADGQQVKELASRIRELEGEEVHIP